MFVDDEGDDDGDADMGFASEELIETDEDAVRGIVGDLAEDVVIQELLVEAVHEAGEQHVSGEGGVEEEAGSEEHGCSNLPPLAERFFVPEPPFPEFLELRQPRLGRPHSEIWKCPHCDATFTMKIMCCVCIGLHERPNDALEEW